MNKIIAGYGRSLWRRILSIRDVELSTMRWVSPDRIVPVLAIAAILVVIPSSANSLDCTKATAPSDKLICASPQALKADNAMSAAFFKLLRNTKDPEFHELLIRSQRRWLHARAAEFKMENSNQDDNNNSSDSGLIQVTLERLNSLQDRSLIRQMETQRKAALNDSGGPFAGFRSICGFLSPQWGHGQWIYSCTGEGRRQHNARICSVGLDWASGHMTEYRLVTVVEQEFPRPAASCSIGYAQTTAQCPDASDDAETKTFTHWNTNPVLRAADTLPLPHKDGLWKYDPDSGLDMAEQKWMDECLFAAAFPPPELSRPDIPLRKKK